MDIETRNKKGGVIDFTDVETKSGKPSKWRFLKFLSTIALAHRSLPKNLHKEKRQHFDDTMSSLTQDYIQDDIDASSLPKRRR